MAHIQKTSTGRWQVRFRSPDGREHSRNFKRNADAKDYLATVDYAKRRGAYRDPKSGRQTLGVFYLSSREDMQLQPSTAAKYDAVWRVHVSPRLGSTR